MLTLQEVDALKIAKEQAERDAKINEREDTIRREIEDKHAGIVRELKTKDESNRGKIEPLRTQETTVQEALPTASEKQLQLPTINTSTQSSSGRRQLIGVRSLCEDPEKCKLIRQHLLLFMHAQNCQHHENQANAEQWQCNVPSCKTMKDIIKHMKTCQVDRSCTVSNCTNTRQIVGHWRTCKIANCLVCSPLKRTNGTPDQPLVGTSQQVEAPLSSAPAAVIAAANSQTPSPGAATKGADLTETESSASLAAMANMHQRLLGLDEAGDFEDPVNVDNQPASPQLSDVFDPDDISPLPSRVAMEWHQSVTLELRKHLIYKVVQTIVPTPDLPSILDRKIYNILLYSRIVEGNFYEMASTRSEYYHLLAEKIYKIEVELEEKRQKCKEQQEQQQLQPQPTAAETPGPSSRMFSDEEDTLQHEQQSRPEQSGCLQIDSLLSQQQQQQLQQWYMQQRLMLFQRQQQEANRVFQSIPSTSVDTQGNEDANDITLLPIKTSSPNSPRTTP